ncbi:MAG: hypothetical protein OEV64_13545 [Desulfobulbaceae bacterium]|nr:hypothetical protein [Desulfobulbaceae bacterium]
MKKIKWLITLFFALLLTGIVALAGDQTPIRPELEIIRVVNRPVMEIFPVVEQLVSPLGKVSADRTANTLVVLDDPAHLALIRKTVIALDQIIPGVNVYFRYMEDEHRQRGLASGSILPEADLTLSTEKSRRDKQLMLHTSSGSPAYLAVGKNVPVDHYWLAVFNRHGLAYGRTTEQLRLETGLEVTATPFGEMVELILVPRISFMDGETIQFRQSALKINVAPDNWTPIASMNEQNDDILRAIVLGTTAREAREIFMEVLVRTDQ